MKSKILLIGRRSDGSYECALEGTNWINARDGFQCQGFLGLLNSNIIHHITRSNFEDNEVVKVECIYKGIKRGNT